MRTFIIPQPAPAPKPRRWNRSPRRHKRIRAIERELSQLLDQALAGEAWRESRRQEEYAA